MSFYYDSFPWFVRAENKKQRLPTSDGTTDWSPKKIDLEFSLDVDKTKLELVGFTQEALEYFVAN